MEKHMGTGLKTAFGDLQALATRLADTSRDWWTNRREDMNQNDRRDEEIRNERRERGYGEGYGISRAVGAEHAEDESFRETTRSRREAGDWGGRNPYGPQAGRERDYRRSFDETEFYSGADAEYSRAQRARPGDDYAIGDMPFPGAYASGYDASTYRRDRGMRDEYDSYRDPDRGAYGAGGRSHYGTPQQYDGMAGDAGMESWQAQQRRGQYRGVGPKNYRRSDSRIAEDLNERLTEDALLDASGIVVSVSDGVVTLQGNVENRWMKHRAEDIADDCSGVRDVRNELRVAGSERGNLSQTVAGATAGVQAAGASTEDRTQQRNPQPQSTTGGTTH